MRLWTEADHRGRKEFEVPEVRRVDLAEAVLFLKRIGVKKVGEFRWLDAPEGNRVREAEELLGMLGAVDGEGELTEEGWEMTRWGMHPRLARLILAGVDFGCVAEMVFVVAVVQGEGVFKRGGKGTKWVDFVDAPRERGNDFAGEWHAMKSAKASQFRPKECNMLGILARGAREAWQGFGQLVERLKRRKVAVGEVNFGRRAEGCAKAMLCAFSDRLAVRRDQGTSVCEVAGGRRGKLDGKSVVRQAGLFVASEITEVEGRERSVNLSRGVAVEEEWLEEMFPGEMVEREGVVFDEIARRVVAVRQRVFRGLVLEEKRGGEVDGDLAGALLAERIVGGDLKLKKWDGKVERWIARLDFLSGVMPELELPGFSEEDREAVIGQMCAGASSYREVKDRDPWPVLREWLSGAQAAALESYAPEKVALVNGVNSRVKYSGGEAPWIEEKVQRLYGVKETPEIANGVKLVVKVLAPNQRPWQVTSDLEGFWERGFAQMKKDLAGRYPKHDWTER